MRAAVRGPAFLDVWLRTPERFQRHFFDTPRRRKKQSAQIAQNQLAVA